MHTFCPCLHGVLCYKLLYTIHWCKTEQNPLHCKIGKPHALVPKEVPQSYRLTRVSKIADTAYHKTYRLTKTKFLLCSYLDRRYTKRRPDGITMMRFDAQAPALWHEPPETPHTETICCTLALLSQVFFGANHSEDIYPKNWEQTVARALVETSDKSQHPSDLIRCSFSLFTKWPHDFQYAMVWSRHSCHWHCYHKQVCKITPQATIQFTL